MLEYGPHLYQKKGFARNPFQELSERELLALFPPGGELLTLIEGGDPQPLQLVGPEGSGKSSALLQIRRYFLQKGVEVMYFHIDHEGEALSGQSILEVPVLLIDEAWRLVPQNLEELLAPRLSRSLFTAFSSHGDLGPVLKMPLSTWSTEQGALSRTGELFAVLVEAFRERHERHELSEGGKEALLRCAAGNLRTWRAHLYEIFTWDPIPPVIEACHAATAHAALWGEKPA
ncbi:MAG: hypothetical protein RDV48_07290 [Candidatus Eremiobacteraeota bacterium]|nr:hypothetical protein [Candidatus Eremiobacteraeota bacterium]